MRFTYVFSLVFLFACSAGALSTPHQLLQNALVAHDNAESYDQWMESPDHPKNWSQQPADQTVPVSSLCEEIQLLPIDKTALFLDYLPSPCQDYLELRLNNYYQKFQLWHLKNRKTISGSQFLGPTRETIVDTRGGPIFITGDVQNKEIALTFDDGPHSRHTEKLLNILEREKVRANFFVVGQQALVNGDILQEISRRGHTVSNHSQKHLNLPKFDTRTGKDEIIDGFESMLLFVPRAAPFFRFPYGAKTKYLRDYLKQQDTSAFYWNIDTLDWKKTNPKVLLPYALKQIENAKRGIVLFHDVQPQTIAIMPSLLFELRVRGFKTVVHRPLSWLRSER